MSLERKSAPPAGYADVEATPPHLVAEIIDGRLVTHPRPSPRHGGTAIALGDELTGPFQKGRGGPGGWVFFTGPEVRFGSDMLVPDIAGWRRRRMQAYPPNNWFETSPDWVCEILSGSTERRDRTVKMRIYGEAGIPFLWLVDPRLQLLEAYENTDSKWTRFGSWISDEAVAARPFDAVSFRLGELWPLDPPLGMNEDPSPYFAGDR